MRSNVSGGKSPRWQGLWLGLLLTLGGCGATQTPSATVASAEAPAVEAEAPAVETASRARAMALLARSCAPCHRHQGSIEPEAIEHDVYFETDTEILRLATQRSVGHTRSNLVSLFAQRVDGRELMVGRRGDRRMPPSDARQPDLSADEARQIMVWLMSAAPAQ